MMQLYKAITDGKIRYNFQEEDIICKGEIIFTIDDRAFRAPADMHITRVIVPEGYYVDCTEPLFEVQYD